MRKTIEHYRLIAEKTTGTITLNLDELTIGQMTSMISIGKGKHGKIYQRYPTTEHEEIKEERDSKSRTGTNVLVKPILVHQKRAIWNNGMSPSQLYKNQSATLVHNAAEIISNHQQINNKH